MTREQQSKTLVLGLGNPVVCDDRVGLAVVECVERLLCDLLLPNVDVATSTRGGFELLELLHGYQRAILVDCVQSPHPVPGRVRHLTLEDISGCARLVNAHEISLAEVYRLAALLDIALPADLQIYAVEAGDIETITEEMTPPVQAAVEPLARKIVNLLPRLAAA